MTELYEVGSYLKLSNVESNSHKLAKQVLDKRKKSWATIRQEERDTEVDILVDDEFAALNYDWIRKNLQKSMTV